MLGRAPFVRRAPRPAPLPLPGTQQPGSLGPAPFARPARQPAPLALPGAEQPGQLGPASSRGAPHLPPGSVKKALTTYDDVLELLAHPPNLAESLVWQDPASHGAQGTLQPYHKWKPSMRTWLREYYHRLVSDGDRAKLYEPPPATALPRYPGSPEVYFPHEVALHTYLSHVAWALYLEGQNRVLWKLSSMTDYDREEILASHRYHERIRPMAGKTYPSGILAGHDFRPTGERLVGLPALRGDPRVGYWFMHGTLPGHS
ncbi:MAG: hypothetical protein HY744_07220 [Deltaproteobacteria bacterium]|nr:hypothetical protein [Deltaproteobacteria bacterium]